MKRRMLDGDATKGCREVLNVARISPTDVARSQIQGSRSQHSGDIHDGFLSLARVSSRKYDLLLVFVSKVKVMGM